MPISYPLDYRDINPVIRIAHRLNGPQLIPRRRIFDYELVLITSGRVEFFDDTARRTCVAGDILVIPPFQWHGFRPIVGSPCEHIAVHFDFAPGMTPPSASEAGAVMYEVRLSEGLRLPDFVSCRVGNVDEVESEMASLVRAWEDPRPPAALEARSHLLQVLLALLRAEAATSRGQQTPGELRNLRRVERAIRYVDQHFAQRIEAADLAAAAGLSVSQLARLFRERTGHAPMQYLRRVRVDRARHLLADIDLSIKEIAGRCGFDDPYHFSRVFRQLDGLPPTLYREAVLAGRAVVRESVNSRQQ